VRKHPIPLGTPNRRRGIRRWGPLAAALAGVALVAVVVQHRGVGRLGGLSGGLIAPRGTLPWVLSLATLAALFATGVELARWGMSVWMARARRPAVQPQPKEEPATAKAVAAATAPAPAADAVPLAALADLGLAVVLTDQVGIVRHANGAATELLEDGKGARPDCALDARGRFFGLPIEGPDQLAPLLRFFAQDRDSGSGEVTIAGSRRRVSWAGQVLASGGGRLFVMRDVTDERRFEVLKSDFLATVSHELRTPLTSLRGSLELVVSRAAGLGQTDTDLLQIGIKNTERLIRLINDLLDVDRLEQGTLAFQFASLDVGALVASAVESVRADFEAGGVTLEVDVAADLPSVHGDRERLAQVLLALLDNARKFAPAGSGVRLRALGTPEGVQIDVADQGPGIPATELPHVFERFWRGDRSGPEAGAGLGLAISRAIVGRHEGHVWLESEQGNGTTASFVLPRSIFRADAPEAPRPPAPHATAGTTILVVEDDSDARAVLRASLEQHGYMVLEAATGGHAVRLARRERPHVVLLDLVLPDNISGYDVLRIVKNDPETSGIPVVVLSVEPERDLARRLGAWDALQKPIDFESVRWSLVGALRSIGRGDGRLVLGVGPTVSRDLAVLAGILEQEAHEVYRARDLEDLARWSAAHYPDLLVLDSDFITQTCAETAATLRAIAVGRPVPVVFLGSGELAEPPAAGWVQLPKPTCKADILEAAEALRTAKGP
jgi:signal transduction histidine kinase/CheY-like chemotaxis protein